MLTYLAVAASAVAAPINLALYETGAPQIIRAPLDFGGSESYRWFAPIEFDLYRSDPISDAPILVDRALLYDQTVALATGDAPPPGDLPAAVVHHWLPYYATYTYEVSWPLLIDGDGDAYYAAIVLTNWGKPAVGELRDSISLTVPEPTPLAMLWGAAILLVVFGCWWRRVTARDAEDAEE